jgi:hypothetical protein
MPVICAGPLPEYIGDLVAQALQKQQRWDQLADWCRSFWEGGEREGLVKDLSTQQRSRETITGWRLENLRKSFLEPYREALSHLGRTGELAALDLDLRTLDPAFGKPLVTGRKGGAEK